MHARSHGPSRDACADGATTSPLRRKVGLPAACHLRGARVTGSWVECMQDMPVELEINGIQYVRKDSIAEQDAELERSYGIRELARNTGFPASTLYDAISRGELRVVMPNGTTKGMRVMRSEWQRYIISRTS